MTAELTIPMSMTFPTRPLVPYWLDWRRGRAAILRSSSIAVILDLAPAESSFQEELASAWLPPTTEFHPLTSMLTCWSVPQQGVLGPAVGLRRACPMCCWPGAVTGSFRTSIGARAGARLAEGSYLAVQVPQTSLLIWDWNEWVFNRANG